MEFAFENTPVYKLSILFNDQVETLCSQLKSQVSFGLIDQLRRAALSISLNIAEGYGRWHKADKQNFYRIARGSVFECVPILQILKLRGTLMESKYIQFYKDLQSLAKIQTGLIKSLEKKESK